MAGNITENTAMISSLSPELWYMVFEEVRVYAQGRSSTDGHPLVQLMLVCKTWKDMVTPLLYRDVSLQPGPRRKLSRFLLAARKLRSDGQCLATFIRHLQFGCYNADADRDILTILGATRQLISFGGMDVSHREVIVLTSGSASTLRSLTMHMSDTCIIPAALDSLRYLKSLVYLQMNFRGTTLLDVHEVGGLDAPQMPLLKDLRIIGSEAYPDVMTYFLRGRFDSLTTMRIPNVHGAAMEALQHFMHLHGQQLEELRFELGDDDDGGIAAFGADALPNVTRVCLDTDSAAPAIEWYLRLPASVIYLDIAIDPLEIDWLFPAHFEELVLAKARLPFKTIRLSCFSWEALYEEVDVDLLGRYVRVAQQLQQICNIKLLDQNGRQWTLLPIT